MPRATSFDHVRTLSLRDPLVAQAQRLLLDGGRIPQEQGVRLFDADVMDLGRLANAIARDRHGDRVYFTRQPPAQPDQRLRARVPVLRLRQEARRARRLHDDEGAGAGARGSRHPRDPHRRRAAQQVALRRLPRHHPLGEGEEARPEREGLHRGRDRLLLPAHQEARRVGARASCARPGSTRCRAAAPRCSASACAASCSTRRSAASAGSRSTRSRIALGIPSNATLLYGHIETRAERVQHLIDLRELERRAPGFFAFIPLAFQPGVTGLVRRQASAIEDLKTIAISRLVFDNVPHVKGYWVMLGQDTAASALNFGASTSTARSGRRRSRTPRSPAARSAWPRPAWCR